MATTHIEMRYVLGLHQIGGRGEKTTYLRVIQKRLNVNNGILQLGDYVVPQLTSMVYNPLSSYINNDKISGI
jgi:hypothetical protein